MKIFVTGGAGFVGRHVTKFLLEQDHNVTIFDNLSSYKGNINTLIKNGVHFIKGDITNYALLKKQLHDFDFVIHLAAKSNVEESIALPELTHRVNVTGTINLLRSCVDNKIKNIISASSASVYGNQNTMPISESSSTIPISPYGATKLAIEHYLQAFSNCYNLNSVSLRFFNIYGSNQSSTYAGVIDKFMEQINLNKNLIIYGSGKNTRDFISIYDAVNAIHLSMNKIQGKKGNIYNIATGHSISIKNLAKMMVSLSGKKLKIFHNKPRKGDIIHSRASITLAKKDLGYIPKIPLKKGLERLMHERDCPSLYDI